MSGYDVARALRQSADLQDKMLVAVSGYGHYEAREKAINAGFDKHLTKPVSLTGLHEIVRSIPCGADMAAATEG